MIINLRKIPLGKFTDSRWRIAAKLSELSGWQIAHRYGLWYVGDSDPFSHGGYFLQSATWDKWGYVSALEIWQDGDNIIAPIITGIWRCVVNRPDDSLVHPNPDPYEHNVESDDCPYGWDKPQKYYGENDEIRFWFDIIPILRELQNEG